jgi:xanthine dehydrogenase accessory factor
VQAAVDPYDIARRFDLECTGFSATMIAMRMQHTRRVMHPNAAAMDVHRKIVELIDGGHSLAVATVLSTHGSTPQQVGAKAAIDAAGRLWGTVGGGPVEAEAQRVAVEACRAQRPCVFTVHLDNADAAEAGSICGGSMRILVDPTVAQHRSCYAAAADALARRQRGALVTTISKSDPPQVVVKWLPQTSSVVPHIVPDTGDECSMEIFVEPIIPRPLLLIAGGGHVGQALAAQAVQIGFDVTVVDDRPEFADTALFPPGVEILCGSLPEMIRQYPMDGDTYVVLVTRGHREDAEALAACIHRLPAYIGMIGSRRKTALIRQSFLEGGLATEEEFDRVFAPIGAPIGAVTVPEIAVSIAAQLIAVRRKAGIRSESGPRCSD